MTKQQSPDFTQHFGQATFLGDFENGSQQWHDLRNQPGVISGSEIGTILGLSPWTSAYTLWAQKTGLLSDTFEQNLSMRLGQLIEPAILQLYREQHPEQQIFEVGTFAHKDFPWAHANPDALCIDEIGNPFILEIKHTATYWDSIPENYQAQVFWYMWIFNVRKAVFAVVNAGRYKEYVLDFDDFEFAAILDKVLKFKRLVETGEAPDWDGSDSTFETVRSLSPGIEDTREDLGQLGIELWNANEAVKKAETHLTEMKSRTIAALNGAKYGIVEDTVVCVLTQKGAGKPYLTIKEKK